MSHMREYRKAGGSTLATEQMGARAPGKRTLAAGQVHMGNAATTVQGRDRVDDREQVGRHADETAPPGTEDKTGKLTTAGRGGLDVVGRVITGGRHGDTFEGDRANRRAGAGIYGDGMTAGPRGGQVSFVRSSS